MTEDDNENVVTKEVQLYFLQFITQLMIGYWIQEFNFTTLYIVKSSRTMMLVILVKVYLVDREVSDIVGVGDVYIILPNKNVWPL